MIKPGRWHTLAAALLVGVAFGLAVIGASRTSITTDEGLHIVFGYSVLDSGDWRMLEQHPPLVHELSTWPLLLVPDLPHVRDMPGWAESDRLKVARSLTRYRPLDRVVFPVRVPVALLSALLGAFVYRWASDWFGRRAGLLALGLYALDPNILSNAQVLTTDLAAACFSFIALYFLQRFLRRSTWGRLLIAGVAIGLALAAKISVALVLPVAFLLLIAHALIAPPAPVLGGPPQPSRRVFARRLALAFMAMMVVAFVALWAVYGFSFDRPPGWPFSVPAGRHIITLQYVQAHMNEGNPAYLLGQVGTRGWWWYFPFTFAVKTPLPTLILLGASAVGTLASIYHSSKQGAVWSSTASTQWLWRAFMLGLFPILFFASTLLSTITIGYRHILPIVPFIFVFIAGQITNFKFQISDFKSPISHLQSHLPWKFDVWHLILFLLALWYVASAALVFPFPAGYFNELAGGPAGGWKYLADSNTEWGQSVKELKRYLDEHGLESIRLSLFTFTDPAAYGLRYQPLPPMKDTPAVLPSRFNPPPGLYAISTTSLDGIPLADVEQYDWFRRQEPIARLAHTLFVYQVPKPAIPRTWVAQCITPVAPLDASEITEGFGQSDLRQAAFDCTRSWLYPPGAGWYVLSRDVSARPDSFVAAQLAGARLSYEQTRTGFVPPFSVFEAKPGQVLPKLRQQGQVAPGDWAAVQAESAGKMTVAPVRFEGGSTWLGYTFTVGPAQNGRGGQTVELRTYWEVEQLPAEPLSLMAHLIAADGRVVAVADGLGVPVENWLVGDMLVQRHIFEVPASAPPGPYWFRIGVYKLAGTRRLPALLNGLPAGDQILLPQAEPGQ